MKSLRNKVILSGIVLVFAFIATIGSTYAWFTVSSSTTIEALTLNVSAEENMLIRVVPVDDTGFVYTSTETTDYQTSITEQDLLDAGYFFDFTDPENPTDPWGLLPTTIINNDYATFNKKALNYLTDISVSTRPLAPATFNNGDDGRYIQVKFMLLSQAAEDQVIELSSISIQATNGTTKDNVVDALRLSIWLDDTLGGGTNEGAAVVFGRDTDFAYDFADTEGDIADHNTLAQHASSLDASAEVVDIWDGAASQNLTTDIYDAIKYNTPTLVTINIFVEGWDEQADNLIIGAYFSIAFGFKFGEVGDAL